MNHNNYLKTQLLNCNNNNNNNNANKNTNNNPIMTENLDTISSIPIPPTPPQPPISPPVPPANPPVPDPVAVFDKYNLDDPLVYPTARPASYIFRQVVGNPAFNFPTRGFPDKPSYVGNLIEKRLVVDKNKDNFYGRYNKRHNKTKSYNSDSESISSYRFRHKRNKAYDDLSILQLIAQQKYPASYKFNYYVLLTDKSPPIKIKVKKRGDEEIYDGDEVIIPELGNRKYIFFKNDSPYEYSAWY